MPVIPNEPIEVTPPTPGLLTVPEAAKQLRLSVRTVRSLIAHRKLAVVKVTNHAIRIRQQAISDFISKRELKAA